MTFDPRRHHRSSIRLRGYDYSSTGAYLVTACTQGRECLFGEIISGEMRLNDAGRIVAKEWLRTSTLRPGVTIDASEFVVMPNHMHGIVRLSAARNPLGGESAQQINPVQNNGGRGDLLVAPPEDVPTNPEHRTNPPDSLSGESAQQINRVQNNGGRGDLLVAPPEDVPTNPEHRTNPGRGTNPPEPLCGRGDQQVAPTRNGSGSVDLLVALPEGAGLDAEVGPRPRSIGAIMAGFKAAVTKRINVWRGTPGVLVWQRNYHEHIIRGDVELARIQRYIHENPQRWLLDRENPAVHADANDEPWTGR